MTFLFLISGFAGFINKNTIASRLKQNLVSKPNRK
jgi:hypothetical protein